jgi:Ca2+-transporting ATPase
METWYKDSLLQITQRLSTCLVNGLDDLDASLRLEREGLNIIKIKKRKTAFQIFLNQFSNLMILILIGAAFLASFFGEVEDTFAIAIIILLNTVLGFAQEYKAEKALNLLKTFSTFSNPL